MSNPTATHPAAVGLGAGTGTRRFAVVAWVTLVVALAGAVVALALAAPGHVRPAGRLAAPTGLRYVPVVRLHREAGGWPASTGSIETTSTRFDGGPQEGSRGASPARSEAPAGRFTSYQLHNHGG
jgi:hypothetical protein